MTPQHIEGAWRALNFPTALNLKFVGSAGSHST